jgi:hypothetical protein
MGEACSSDGEGIGVYRILLGKPEGKRPLGRSRRRWEDNIKSDFQKVGCGGMDWIEVVQDRNRWRGPCECGNEPSGSINLRERDHLVDPDVQTSREKIQSHLKQSRPLDRRHFMIFIGPILRGRIA